MKKFLSYLPLSAAALVALSFAACTDSDVVANGSTTGGSVNENAITFSTYMGSSIQTRAGVTGSYNTDYLKGFKQDGTDWSEPNAKKQGFGVFAYYTGTQKYEDKARTVGAAPQEFSNQSALAANFMFNQLVWWNNEAGTDLVTKWTYSPIKYWPNEVNPNGDVDDQNNNTSNDPAKGGDASNSDLQNGGNVSFFAYAPYVKISDTDLTTEEKKSGIVAINGQTTIAANAEETDPILTYKLPSATTEKAVDLLWGTTGINGTGVAGADNKGVQGDGNNGNNNSTSYVESILDSYRMNADLTKQTTEGTISFLFKHALAKIGGSYIGTGEGDDEDGTTATNGLMVILDIDDMKGAESGGSLEKYYPFTTEPVGTLEAGSKPEWNKYNTKVLINEIVIESKKQLTDAGKTALNDNSLDFDFSNVTMSEALKGQGNFNLATGQWANLSGEAIYKQTIETSTKKPGEADYGKTTGDASKDAILSEEITEPNTLPERNKAGFESLPIGVTTVAKNVYETETNPLVFIPGTMPVLEITITYTVRTYDPNLNTKYTEVKQRIKKNLYITKAVELNKQYNILMHLGLTSVKFTATVSDWETTNATGTTTVPDDGTSPVTVYEEEMEHVYLPINVGEPNSVTATITTEDNVNEAPTGQYNLGSKPVSSGSAVKFLTVTGMKANFGDGAKPVEMSHVTVQALDKNDQPVDWITWNYDAGNDKIEVNVKNNETVDDRTAKLRIIYDNVAEEHVVKQYGRKIQANFTVKFYSDATHNTEVTTLASGATKYYTGITAEYKDLKNDGTDDGEAKAWGTTIYKGYTLTAGEFTTVSGTEFSTKQYVATTEAPINPRSETASKELKFTYDGVTVEKPISQEAPVVSDVIVTVGGSTTPTYAASTTTTGAIKVVAKFKDSNNKAAGEAKVENAHLATSAAANTFSYSIEQTGSWASMTSGNGTLTMDKNTGAKREATLKVQYGDETGAPVGQATITQKQP